ncbi:MAG: PstS family phosphate ABC transporter substrate-binding protein [Myxococcota bacterium]
MKPTSVVRAGTVGLTLVTGCLGRADLADRTVRLVGSDTELSATQMLAEAYRQRHPDVVVSVAGGGSGAGIAALLDGRTDIANSSREIRSEERKLAERRGLEVEEIVLGIDALAVIVNENNPVNVLDMDALGRLYRGTTRSWSDLGGKRQTVTLYGRQSNSGTYVFFRESVVQDDYALGMRNLNGNAQIVEAVRADPGGIGYVGVGYVLSESGNVSSGVTVVGIETVDGGVVHPGDAAAVERGAYPISRPLFQYVTVPMNPQVSAFLWFELSDDGQAIVAKEGFYRASRASRDRDRALLGRVKGEPK